MPSVANKFDNEYRNTLHHAVEYVHVVAARRGLDTRQLLVTIDADRDAGIYWDHSLTISVRSAVFSVTAEGVPPRLD